MATRRGAFVLTPPTVVVFVISIVLALLALVARFGGVKIPIISPTYIFHTLAVAYLLLVVGVLFRRL